MKLVTFEVHTVLGRFSRLGALVEEQVLDLNAGYLWLLDRDGEPTPRQLANALLPSDMRQFIKGGTRALEAAREVLDAYDTLKNSEGINGETLVFHPADVRLRTPLPDPKMLRDFLAFEVHTKAGFDRRKQPMPEAWYKLPVYYKGNPTSLIGPEDPVLWPRYTKKFDYELELACIIGKKGKNVSEADAGNYIFGYANLNDFSARDIQGDEMTCRLGPAKGKDFATAVGPYILTADEVGDPRNLKMTARINGEIWSQGNTGTCHWTWEQMIAHVSNEETIYPGDILGSGTVGNGCGWELGRWLQPGDVVEIEVEGLGILRNRVVTHEMQTQEMLAQEGAR